MEGTPHHEHPHHGNRQEDRRLVTGQGCYTADWSLPGQLHACFVRADRAHAEILSVDTSAAAKAPGVHAVLTGDDALKAGYIQFLQMLTFPGVGGQKLAKPDRPVLATKRVRHVGEPVAMVVADTAGAAQDAAELIVVEYRDLPAVAHPVDALQPGAPQLHTEAPGNLAFEYDIGDQAAVEAAFKAAHHITTLEVVSSRVAPNPMEPRACVIDYDAKSDAYALYAPVQGINIMRLQTTTLTGVPEEKLTIRARDVGGSFGQRSQHYPEYAVLMIASKQLGRPVRWVSSRTEGFMSDTHGRAIIIRGRLALDKDGKFLAMRFDYTVDLGAYPSPTGGTSHTRNPSVCLTGVYKVPALYGHFRLALTNTVPVAAYRGAGRPDCAYAIERLVDQAAHELKIDPAELRRRNFIPRADFPYKTATGSTYEEADFLALQQKAMKVADYAGFAARKAESAKRGKLRGLGMSTVIENTGAGLFPKDQVELDVGTDGTITSYTVSHSSGQSHETTFAMIVGAALGIDADRVRIRQGINERPLIGNHTGGSRSLVGAGSVHKVVAQKLIEQLTPMAAEALSVEPSQVKYAHGAFSVGETGKSITFGELATRHTAKTGKPLTVAGEGSVSSTFPNACHISEVEIDPATGASDVARYTAVDDCGTVINHTVVEGQVHGAIIQGAGQIFGEEVAYDRATAQLLSASFMDYAMPRAGFIREMTLDENPVPSKINSLGAKGCGEAGCGGSMPALSNAVNQALREQGVASIDMPMTAHRVWSALRAAGHKG